MPRLALLLLLCACKADRDVTPDGALPRSSDATATPGGDASSADATSTPTDCEIATTRQDFTYIQDSVFTPSCATSMCHAGAEPEVGLSLEAGVAYANLVNKGASTVEGWIRVVPNSVPESYLAVSLGRAEGPPPRDGFMPLGAEPLCVEKLEMIERWIKAGAPND